MTQLIDNACYTLPDGTLVRFIAPLIGSARLDAIDGTPLLIRDGTDGWKTLRWSDYLQDYEAAACDLLDRDIEPVF